MVVVDFVVVVVGSIEIGCFLVVDRSLYKVVDKIVVVVDFVVEVEVVVVMVVVVVPVFVVGTVETLCLIVVAACRLLFVVVVAMLGVSRKVVDC